MGRRGRRGGEGGTEPSALKAFEERRQFTVIARSPLTVLDELLRATA